MGSRERDCVRERERLRERETAREMAKRDQRFMVAEIRG